jgi:NAD(P)-dependent dehydrogenase (short-subunit alcohol dehydrogenase family)
VTHRGRIVLVTGATRGLGRAVALALAEAGAHVVALARDRAALEALDDEIRKTGGAATLTPLDLRDGAALDALGATIHQRWGRLDALFASGGILGPLTPLAHLDPGQFDEVMAVNLAANARLVRSLDPCLRQSPAGRVVFVSSGAARRIRAFWGGYAVSKAALEALALTYAAECEGTAIRVNILNPGPLRTLMRAQAMPGEDPASLPEPQAVAPLVLRMLSPDYGQNGILETFRTA